MTQLLAAVRIVLMPTLNPDGYAAAFANHVEGAPCSPSSVDNTVVGRLNAHNVDLDHNFPRRGVTPAEPLQPETKALIAWLNAQSAPTLFVNLIGGNLVAMYPWDKNPQGLDEPAPTVDDSLYRDLAMDYATAHPSIGENAVC